MPRLPPLLLVALSSLASLACQGRERADPSPAAQKRVAEPPLPSASAPAQPAAPTPIASAVPGVPFEVRPAAQVKHTVAIREVVNVTAEPGVMLGPKREFVKAFDCTSKGAPKRDMFGVCVGFKSCETVQPARSEVLAAIRCKGPELTLELRKEGVGLVFRAVEPDHPLGTRPMTPIALPEGTRPEILPFERKNLTTYIDV